MIAMRDILTDNYGPAAVALLERAAAEFRGAQASGLSFPASRRKHFLAERAETWWGGGRVLLVRSGRAITPGVPGGDAGRDRPEACAPHPQRTRKPNSR